MAINKADLLRSILVARNDGINYCQWATRACIQFGIFRNPLERALIDFLTEAMKRTEGQAIFNIIRDWEGLPGTVEQIPKSPILASHFQGKAVDFAGRPLSQSPKFKGGKQSPLSKVSGISAHTSDRKYVKSLRKSKVK